MVRFPLILVTLNPEQIVRAKEVNGKRKRITHALLCGPYGQIFGTEKHCIKYYTGWKQNFPTLFSEAKQTDVYKIVNFETTFDLVSKFIDAEDAQKTTRRRSGNKSESVPKNLRSEHKNTGNSGCLALMLTILLSVILITMNTL